jgi:GT2 family glycosyltransferase
VSGASVSPAISVVIVTYDSADALALSLPPLAPQLRPGDEVIIVDNASRDGSVEVARRLLPAATIVETGGNVGFAAGCNRGVERASAPVVLLLNPDAVAAPDLLERLRDAAAAHPSWGAWQALVTLEDEDVVNTSGNLVHWLGFGWAGELDLPVAQMTGGDREVGFASGAALAVRREAWQAVGGFDEHYFMYGEDLDLCLRLRLAGWRVGTAPAARVAHDYTFTKGGYKWFYLERNRWWTVLGAYPLPVLLWALPGLLAFELALLPAALAGGWLRPKLRAQAAVVRELPAIFARRRRVQATRAVSARAFAEAFTSSLDSPHLAAAGAVPVLVALQAGWWRLLLRWLR